MSKPLPPEVDPAEYPQLNANFYGADPVAYLEARTWALMVAIGDSAAFRVEPATLTYEDVTVRRSGLGDPADVERYAVLESTVLLHHSYEAMLRLYLAHAFGNPCPWLAVAKLRTPRDFRAAIEELSDDLSRPARIADLLEVFSWSKDAAGYSAELTDPAWESHVRGLVALVRQAISTWLDDANYYNAAKHGLAILAGNHTLTFTTESGPPRSLSHSGPALEILDQDWDTKLWALSTRWLNPAAAIATVTLVTTVMGSLWATARRRHGLDADPTRMRLLDGDEVTAVFSRPHAGSAGITQMRWSLGHTTT